MIFSYEESNVIYDNLYNWLAHHSVGSRTTKSLFKNYQKLIWNPILNKINLIQEKPNLTDIEKEFLNLTLYRGPIFRLQNYNTRLQGHIYPMCFYQSWSKDIEGLQNVNGFHGKLLLIQGTANLGIDVFGLLTFLLEQKYITPIRPDKHPQNLLKYENENEVSFPIQISSIEKIYIVDKESILESIKENNCLSKEKWIRNKLN